MLYPGCTLTIALFDNSCTAFVRNDLRCGDTHLVHGHPAVCAGRNPCCSGGGWCGNTDDHCKCPTCIDYRHGKPGDKGQLVMFTLTCIHVYFNVYASTINIFSKRISKYRFIRVPQWISIIEALIKSSVVIDLEVAATVQRNNPALVALLKTSIINYV